MAYVSAADKAKLAPTIRAVLKKYNMKGSIAVRNHSTLVVNIKSGDIDFSNYMSKDSSYIQVNPYYISDHYMGTARAFLLELSAAMKGPDFYDNTDIMTDYFDVSHYVNINIGQWSKPYTVTGAKDYA
jgi:hypothetical protein